MSAPGQQLETPPEGAQLIVNGETWAFYEDTETPAFWFTTRNKVLIFEDHDDLWALRWAAHCERRTPEPRPEPAPEPDGDDFASALMSAAIPMQQGDSPAAPAFDPVQFPSHYTPDGQVECIDALQAALGHEGFLAFCRGNVIKYLWRAGRKTADPRQDLEKAMAYLRFAINELEGRAASWRGENHNA